ncbi:MAG: hypothetical protein AAF410_03460 [Pseudomonadota bacterium]
MSELKPALANESGLKRPEKGSVYAYLLEGLILLADRDVVGWISGYCDGIRLCRNETEVKFIREHRIPLQERIASTCLKDGDRALHIEKVIGSPDVDVAVKVYLVCEQNGPPRFYSLRKTAGHWFFISI